MARRDRIEIDWEKVFDSRSPSPDGRTFYSGSAPGARAAPATRRQIKVDWGNVFGFGTPSSSPDRVTFHHPGTAPADRAAVEGGDEPRRGASSRPHHPGADDLPCRIERGAGGRRRRPRAVPEAAARRPSVDAPAAAAKEDEHEGEGTSASAAKKSRKLDTEKEDALLHMLGEINKSLQASLKPAEPIRAPKETSPEEIFEALKGIPRLARSDQLRAYSMLTRDDRRFRSLMALPKNMRKEWLLLEIGSI